MKHEQVARPPTVLLAPTGTLGDIHPFVAVALQLRKLGCRPILAVMDDYRDAIAAEGLETVIVRPGRHEIEADGHNEASIALAVRSDLRAGLDIALSHLSGSFIDLSVAMRQADIVVGGSLSTAARIAAEAAGLPLITLILQPMGFLSAVEPPVMGEVPWLPVVSRCCGHSAVRVLYSVASWRGRARLRPASQLRRQLGLPVLRDELLNGPLRSERIIAMYPASFAPLPPDAPEQATNAGFAFHDGPATTLDPSLELFLAAGPPPIVFTLGSFVVHAPGNFFPVSAEATRQLGRRAVLLVGQHALERYGSLAGPDIAVIGYAPHSALFSRSAGVVHHAGIGTVAQALRAGVPQLICPYFGDQFDNAARVKRLGVADILSLRRYTLSAATGALERLLKTGEVATRARVLAGRFSSNDGPSLAAMHIAQLASRPRDFPLQMAS